MSGSLPIKYRPHDFDFVYGNDEAIDVIKGILSKDVNTIPSTWLFTGNSGTGKTTIIRILKKYLDCSDTNFFELNSSSDRGIDAIKKIASQARMSAIGGGNKIFLLDEAHNITTPAQQALLKTLEDTPKNTFFMLATTMPEKLDRAIRTRATTIHMKDCGVRELSGLCMDIAEEEGVELSKKVAMKIAQSSNGSPREALKLLDSIIAIEDEQKAILVIEKSYGSGVGVDELCREFMAACNINKINSLLLEILDNTEPELVRRIMMGYFTTVALKSNNTRADVMLSHLVEVRRYDTEKGDIVQACREAAFFIQKKSDDLPF